jgi:L-aspartate oxidase
VVSRAIFQHLEATEADPARATVFLDFSPIDPERIQRRFPNIVERCRQWGVDVFKEPIPVAPAAHYWMGGVVADLACRTSLPGLLAIGETASTGVHGANRLASNSLLECIVFAEELAQIELLPPRPPLKEFRRQESRDLTDGASRLEDLRQALPALMWRAAGICRTQSALESAVEQVEQWRDAWRDLALSQQLGQLNPGETVQLSESADVVQWAEAGNLLDVARLILKSALFRPESRGGHYRQDYPQTRSDWQVHTLVEGRDWRAAPVARP